MNDEYRILFVHYEDDLQEFPLGGRTPHEEFLICARPSGYGGRALRTTSSASSGSTPCSEMWLSFHSFQRNCIQLTARVNYIRNSQGVRSAWRAFERDSPRLHENLHSFGTWTTSTTREEGTGKGTDLLSWIC
jgi:hypothetical protein